MTVSVLEAPAAEPVSVAELKSFLQLVHDTEDALLGRCIAAARDSVELHTGRAIVTRRLREVRTDRGIAPLRLMFAPAPRILSLAVRDSAGIFQAASAVFDLDTDAGLVRFTRLAAGDLQIDYEAGYGGADASPPALKHAVMLAAAHLFRNRSEAGLSNAALTLAAPFVRQRL